MMHRFCLLLLLFSMQAAAKAYVYFSRRDPVIDHLVHWIDSEKKGIDFALFSFTHRKVEAALIRAAERGVRVRLILDNFSRKMAERIVDEGPLEVILIASKQTYRPPIFHHKFILFHENKNSRSWVWTGSFNVSVSAEKKNFENVIILDTKNVFQEFTTYFDLFFIDN